MKTVRMVQPAEQEMLDAAAYYELQVSELGQDFLKKIASAVADIGENPERWPIVRQNVRRRLVHRFPYGLLYREKPGGGRCARGRASPPTPHILGCKIM